MGSDAADEDIEEGRRESKEDFDPVVLTRGGGMGARVIPRPVSASTLLSPRLSHNVCYPRDFHTTCVL